MAERPRRLDNFDLARQRSLPENYTPEVMAVAINTINGLLDMHGGLDGRPGSIPVHLESDRGLLKGVEDVEEYLGKWGEVFGKDASHVIGTAKSDLAAKVGAIIHGRYGESSAEVCGDDPGLVKQFEDVGLVVESILDLLDARYPGAGQAQPLPVAISR